MKYRVHRLDLKMTKDQHTLERFLNDLEGEANSLYHLGHVDLCEGNYPTAQDRYQQALSIYRADGRRQGEADSLLVIGIIHEEKRSVAHSANTCGSL